MFVLLTTNIKEHTFTYKVGLNVNCENIWFTDVDIFPCSFNNKWIRIVIVQENIAISPKDRFYDKFLYSASKIILSEKYSLYDLDTIKKFNLKFGSGYIDNFSALGRTDILDYLLHNQSINEDSYSQDVLDRASSNNKVDVLQWWFNSGLPLKYTSEAIDKASNKGHIEVLNWWLNSGLQLKYTSDAINNTYNLDVLNWWVNSKLPLKYKSDAMDVASGKGYLHVLNWWINSDLDLKYSRWSLDLASVNGHLEVLMWWFNSGLELKYTEKALDDMGMYISQHDIEVLNWWKNSGLILKYSNKALENASVKRHINILEWWRHSGLPLKYSEHTLNLIRRIGHIEVLNWWKNAGVDVDLQANESHHTVYFD
jgi:hypothetical protein